MQRSICLERFVDGIEASMVSGVQGLDPKKDCQPFIGLVRVKECISGVSTYPRDLACLSLYSWGISIKRNTKIISEIL